MSRILLDVNVPMYAAGREHPLREPAQRIVLAVASGDIDGVTDAEVLQEILYRYWHGAEHDKGLRIFDGFSTVMSGRVLPVREEEVVLARALGEDHPTLSPRDLIHLAVMMANDIGTIATADAHFDGIPGIERLKLEELARR